MTLSNLKRFTHYIQLSTKFLAIKGPVGTCHLNPNDTSINKWFLNVISKHAPRLTCLILENHVIDSSKV